MCIISLLLYMGIKIFVVNLNDKISKTNLTSRQTEVLKLLSDGYEDRYIAETLGISIHTVRAFVHKIIFKLEAKNRAHAACKALRCGIIK